MTPLGPIVLAANQPAQRFYRGGSRIARFRGVKNAPDYTPEDWVGSTTCVRGEPGVGVTTLPDGTPLDAAVAADPESWLGAAHVEAFGADTKLLVKLLDAGQRLPVHAHPDGVFARRELGAAHGKAEAWYILSPGDIYLGLRRELSHSELRRTVDDQDAQALLDAMHKVTVTPGDRVYVPPGVLHSIDEGVFLVELQEPEDLSILLEWTGFAIDGSVLGHLGLGFDTALQAVETRRRPDAEVEQLIRSGPVAAGSGSCLPTEAARYFRLEFVSVAGRRSLDPGFTILVVTEGAVTLQTAKARVDVRAGATVLLPASAGPVELTGEGTVLAARPPVPEEGASPGPTLTTETASAA
jgi:mannose-6-phosphate isomerase